MTAQTYTYGRSFMVRRTERWTITTEERMEEMRAETTGEFDQYLCDNGDLVDADYEEVDERDLVINLLDATGLYPDEPEWSAFVAQNDVFMVGLTLDETEELVQYASHHAGGLFVLIRPVIVTEEANVYAKVHDSWGDDAGIVLHIYDADADDQNDDVQVYFSGGDGNVAARMFLDLEVLRALWRSR